MIWADGKVDEFERKALEKFCYKFGFEKENIDDLADFLLMQAKDNIPFEKIKETVISMTE